MIEFILAFIFVYAFSYATHRFINSEKEALQDDESDQQQ